MIEKDRVKTIKRIYKLSNDVANQIAAGEVIERPASVLKELLENSIDSNATEINITIEQGGIKLIKVQDNGCGILKEDLELALTQHATSKIKTVNELECLSSYGFRGEALASIASVAKLKLTSCPISQETGFSIEKEGREERFKTSQTPKILGTTIEVKDLFYNTPARRQFLRSEKTELNYIEQMIKRIILSQPAISFTIKTSDRFPQHYKNCKTFESFVRRVRDICGNAFLEKSHYIEAESNGLILKGWLGAVNQLRMDPDLQYFYVNGRIIRDRLINHAVRQSFQEYCTLGRYPSYVLFLEVDPKTVDVNVHPTKHEVRFRDARTVYAFITYNLQQSLNRSQLPQLEETKNYNVAKAYHPNITNFANTENIATITNYANTANITTITDNVNSIINSKFGKPLCIINNELFLLEKESNLIIIDIPTLFQKILEIELNDSLFFTDNSKLLLMPISIPIPKKAIISEDLELHLIQLGFQWTELSEESILLRAIPKILKKVPEAPNKLFDKLLKFLNKNNIKNEAILCIAEHIATNYQYSFEDAKDILSKYERIYLKNEEHNQNLFNKNSKIYRKINTSDLKHLLFNSL